LWSIHYSVGTLSSEKKLTAAVIRMCAPLSKLADHVIFVSQASRNQHEPLRYRLNKSCVIPNGIDVTKFVPSPESRASVRAELGLPADALLIGVMGRCHPMKDHENFLRAAALVSRKYPKIHFLLAGSGVDSQNRKLSSCVRELGLSHQTHLLGERSDIPRLAASLDVFCLPSYGESFPNVIGEAMSCQVPCVVTDVGDAAWIVGNTGRVVQPRDPGAMADALVELIELGQVARKSLGHAARARVIERFTLASVVVRYETLYETVLASETSAEFGLTPPEPALP
jgi:glycosyltransferase involved in cell wall biosynthesis